MAPKNDFYARMTRGVILSHLYTAWEQGLTDPANPRTMGKVTLETSLAARAAMPPLEDFVRALNWLEGAEYVTVEWQMDDQRDYESVCLTQKGLNLYENKRAAQIEPGMALPPRR